MKKFRRTVAGLLVGTMLLSMAGCGSPDPDDYEYGKSLEQLTEEEVVIAGGGTGGSSGGGLLNPGSLSGDPKEFEGDFEPVQYSDTENKEFEEFILQEFKDSVTADTLSYNFTVLDGSKYGIEAPSPATLGDADMSEQAILDGIEETKENYEKLIAFEGQPMTEEEYFTYIVLKDDYERTMFQNDNYLFYEPFSPMRGFQANIGTNFAEYRFDDKTDVEDYIAMMNQLPDYVSHICEYENYRVEKGYGMQDAACDDVIEQCETFVEDPENNFLIKEFDSKIDNLDFLTDEEKADFKAQDKEAVLNGIIPCMNMIKDCVAANKGKATVEGGLCEYENGKEYYQKYILPHFAGTSRDVEDIIDMFETRYSDAFTQMSMMYLSNADAYNFMVDNMDTLFANTDNMKVDDIINKLMSDEMGEYPKLENIPYKSDYLSPAMETILDSTLAYYMSPAIDDEEHNIIRVNGSHTDGIYVTLAHEGCPGHMYQNAYFQSTNPKPIRAIADYMGYQEGWAVYTSFNTLKTYDFEGTEDDEIVGQLYRLNDELGYMLYGRVDIGVNYEGWSVQDVADYMNESGFSGEYAEELFNTVVGDPGVYLSYSLSEYLMEELREKTETALGDKFDPVEFHRVILTAGPCQFEELEFKLREYIYEQQ